MFGIIKDIILSIHVLLILKKISRMKISGG